MPSPASGSQGRRFGLLSILLVQMFPQFLAIVALYLMFATITDLWPAIGFNTVWGLLLLYMGGALGVNTWLMKGFFDTIPKDLDESAKVDGASHAQIFFGIILPLVAPILAVTGLLGFIGAVNEFLIASIFLTQDSAKTAAVGLYGLVSQERNNNFGVFAAGTLILAIPTVALFQFLQRYIVGGLTGGAVKADHDALVPARPAAPRRRRAARRQRRPRPARRCRCSCRMCPGRRVR